MENTAFVTITKLKGERKKKISLSEMDSELAADKWVM